MKQYFSKSKSFFIGVVVASSAFIFIQAKTADSYFEISKNLEIIANVFKELNTYYVDPIEPGKLTKTAIDAMLNELDPYTNYITESDIETYEFQMTGKYGGIGAIMRKKGEDIFVGDVYENSPSQKAGLHTGDQIISIDDHSVSGKSIEDISVLLKGSPGTQLILKIKDAYSGETIFKTLIRGEIEVPSVPYAALYGTQKDIAYVSLTQFTNGCSHMLREALDSLKTVNKNLKGVVLDLRNNPGGLLNEAVNVCNLFLEKGQLIVTTKGKEKELDKEYKTVGAAWDNKIPVTVLVNGHSASASEIVAGTLQDLDRGIIIGSQSYGKGLVQVTHELGYNAKLKLTIAKYYTPSGRCIQAIDYSNRNLDGSASKVPDSLKKVFTTKAGRKVLSGGGIEPDVKITDVPTSQLAIVLYSKNFIFDYATQYAKQHSTIAPAASFKLTDAEFDQFAKYLQNKDYAYKTATETALDSLKAIAESEKYFDAIKPEYEALQGKLAHDKQKDLIKNKTEIQEILENEIVSRYYFLKGRWASRLQYDNDFSKALGLLEQPNSYNEILKKK
jgi:carboxyl-terminal processing protease